MNKIDKVLVWIENSARRLLEKRGYYAHWRPDYIGESDIDCFTSLSRILVGPEGYREFTISEGMPDFNAGGEIQIHVSPEVEAPSLNCEPPLKSTLLATSCYE